jgi:micrococcal nuclease
MVRFGYAALSTYPPDVKYIEQIREANTFAREHGYGIWSACQTNAKGNTNELGRVPAPVSVFEPGQQIITAPVEAVGCDPSYPDACIPPPLPELD